MALYFVVHKDLFSKGDNIMLDVLFSLFLLCVLIILFFKILFFIIKKTFDILITGIAIVVLLIIFAFIVNIGAFIIPI